MPPSLGQDTSNTSTGNNQSNRQSRKASPSGGAQTSSKKKNGKEKDAAGGGVLAAVTKNATKMSAKNTKASATPLESPEIKPVSSVANGNGNGNPITSPLLDALSSATIAQSASQHTNEWAKNVPPYSSSPNNLINLEESPPTFPSSYEERLAGLGWNTKEQRGAHNGQIASASPPAGRRRPLSYQMEGNTQQYPEDYRSQVSGYAPRRSSMYSPPQRYPFNPPLPHQAQSHFYGAPDVNLLLSPPGPGLIPGENGYYCGFDSLPSASSSSKDADKVLLTGYEGGINVHSVTKRGLHKIATLDGLRGGVYHAKILPWNTPEDPAQASALIALVVHGPVWSSEESGTEDTRPLSDEISAAPSIRGSPRIPSHTPQNAEMIESYQTSVEVYSLGNKQHVATLLSIPETRLAMPPTSPLFKPPLPSGALTIHADSGNLVIASGSTGEAWIFRQKADHPTTPHNFKCIGKVWTTVQHGVSIDTPTSNGLTDGDWYSTDVTERKQYKSSILSLNGRWLAYCPSTPSSQKSLLAAIPGMPSTAKVPGVNSHAPPQLPVVNCSVETPEGESMVKQLMQAGTQKLLEGSAYIGKQIGKQSAQVWNHYWNKSSQSQSANTTPTYQGQQTAGHHFPPTHAAPIQAAPVPKDPGLVSILDLGALSHHSASMSSPHPLATFKIPHGCSFLSFAPSGLALFTASSKGDVQCVWDLMRLQFSKSSFLKESVQTPDSKGPHIRQIAQFSRMTIARIVDVVWTAPHGERAAMVTEPGTVHILDLPASAFTWPPPRRRITVAHPAEPRSETAGAVATATGVASSAVNSLWTAARPLVGRRRRSSTGISAKTMTAQAGHSTQVLAAGISRSVGAATGKMNEMRKSGSNRLHLPSGNAIPSRCCILLLNRRKNDSVIVVGGGIVRCYTIKTRRADRPADKQKASRGAKFTEFRVPSLPNIKIAPEPLRDLGQVGDLELDTEDSQWKPKRTQMQVNSQHTTKSSIPQAEIESNAPYQPFHTDRRVALHVYSQEGTSPPSPSVSALLSPPALKRPDKVASSIPWAFGGPIKSRKLDIGPVHSAEEEQEESMLDHRALPISAIERILSVRDTHKDVEQIVVTTRRRKGVSKETTDLDEEGFFEDDCEVLDFASQRV